MRYLVIDAVLNGTGIRKKYEGDYITPKELNLSLEITQRLNEWLQKYWEEHYQGFACDSVINKLDCEGKEIARKIKNEVSDVKIEYFSEAKMINEII